MNKEFKTLVLNNFKEATAATHNLLNKEVERSLATVRFQSYVLFTPELKGAAL